MRKSGFAVRQQTSARDPHVWPNTRSEGAEGRRRECTSEPDAHKKIHTGFVHIPEFSSSAFLYQETRDRERSSLCAPFALCTLFMVHAGWNQTALASSKQTNTVDMIDHRTHTHETKKQHRHDERVCCFVYTTTFTRERARERTESQRRCAATSIVDCHAGNTGSDWIAQQESATVSIADRGAP